MQSGDHIPLREIPEDLLYELRERVWAYTASAFAAEGGRPLYVGTVTCVAAAGQSYLLTAAHVWRTVRGARFALSLESDRLLVPVPKDFVDPIVFGTTVSEWGPDLALVRLPDPVARDIRQIKTFYNIDKRRRPSGERPPFETGLWALIGAPAEQSNFEEREPVLKVTLLASVVASAQERDGFDYVDLSYNHEGRADLPRSYGGISGSGLWHLPISRSASGAFSWSGEVQLEGVAFYQQPAGTQEGVIRCHGRKSLYDRALPLA